MKKDHALLRVVNYSKSIPDATFVVYGVKLIDGSKDYDCKQVDIHTIHDYYTKDSDLMIFENGKQINK